MKEENFRIQNYVLSFVDLLGIGDALRGQGMLPDVQDEKSRQELVTVLNATIGAIKSLQRDAERMIETGQEAAEELDLRSTLPAAQHEAWEEMSQTKYSSQRWSDGLVYFVNLGDTSVKCSLNGIYEILVLSGALYFLGLAKGQPIRGAIEIGWGAEINPGELYGSAVARAYELESKVAQYPRIVIGEDLVGLIRFNAYSKAENVFEQNNKSLASICLKMLIQDVDGVWIFHVLGGAFREYITAENHPSFYSRGRNFVIDQLKKFKAEKNTKLALRYSQLLYYFDSFRPDREEGN